MGEEDGEADQGVLDAVAVKDRNWNQPEDKDTGEKCIFEVEALLTTKEESK